MKSILAYGQTIQHRNNGKADNLSVYHAGINAMRDGYKSEFERIVTSAGVKIIRKRKGSV